VTALVLLLFLLLRESFGDDLALEKRAWLLDYVNGAENNKLTLSWAYYSLFWHCFWHCYEYE